MAAATLVHWAVLIGVNFYGGANDLKGCVRDVSAVRAYLQTGRHPLDVATLTATAPPDPTSRRPVEDPDCWPTWANVVERLKRILDNAKPGDLVYVHYAGHGTRQSESAKSAHSRGNLALVLFEETGPGMRYFQGKLLANCLGRMVEKGLLVTVVLDCCFSGSVLRDSDIRGTDVRAIGYNSDVDAAFPPDSGADLFDPGHSFRDAAVPPDQWLVDPDGYTILAACGPHENARELQLATGERRGALTYFLIDALGDLRKRGIDITHESLHEHLRVRFRATWPQQTPMRYGNRNFSFFGQLRAASDTASVPLFKMDDRLCLDAGEAHGIHPGDEYTAHPFGSEDAGSHSDVPIMLRVERVRPLTSDVVIVRPKDDVQVETGWNAKPVMTSIPRHTISVRLAASATERMQQTRQQNRQPAEKGWLHLSSEDEDQACLFNLMVNDRREYEILDGALQKLLSLPTVPLDIPEAEHHVISVLHHLAKFKHAEGIENQLPSPSFEASFSILSSAEGTAPGASTVHDIHHGGTWCLTLHNHSDSPLYLAVFDFTPSWKICNLLSSSGDNSFRVIQPRGEEVLDLRMRVPDWLQHLGERQCEDVIKVFVTSKPTSFPSLILPEIPLHVRHRGNVPGRGDALSTLLAGLTTPFRGGDNQQEAWATRNFIIRTTVNRGDCKMDH